MDSIGSNHIGKMLLAALLVAACGPVGSTTIPATESSHTATVAPTDSPRPTEASVASAEPTPAPTPTPTAEPIDDPEPTAWPCPTDSPINVLELTNARLKCFGSDQIRVRAWLDTGPAIGWLPPTIEPAWLVYPNAQNGEHASFALWFKRPDSRDVICGESYCRFDWVHLPPDSTLEIGGRGRWVIAIGHVNDPAAARCHWSWPDDWEVDPSYKDADAIATCRHAFVLEDIEEIP